MHFKQAWQPGSQEEVKMTLIEVESYLEALIQMEAYVQAMSSQSPRQ